MVTGNWEGHLARHHSLTGSGTTILTGDEVTKSNFGMKRYDWDLSRHLLACNSKLFGRCIQLSCNIFDYQIC